MATFSGSFVQGYLYNSGDITSGYIGNAAVLSGNVGSGQMGVIHMASGTLDTITGSGSVTSGDVASGAILGAIASGYQNIASGTIGGPDLASGAVRSGHVASGVAVTQAEIVVPKTFVANAYGTSGGAAVITTTANGANPQVAEADRSLGQAEIVIIGVVDDAIRSSLESIIYAEGLSPSLGILSGAAIGANVFVGVSGTPLVTSGGDVLSGAPILVGTVATSNRLFVRPAWIGSGYITSGRIASGQIGNRHLASGTVNSGHIASGQIPNNALGSGAVLSAHIASGQISTLKIASGGLLSGAIGSGQVGNSHLGSGSVISARIASGQIGSFHIANEGVLSGNIGSGQITTFHVASGGLLSGAFGSGQIGQDHIGSGGIVSGAIASGQIGSFHIGSGAIVSNLIASGQVGPVHVAWNLVGAAAAASGAILSANIASGQIGSAHLGFSIQSITSGSIQSGHVVSGTIGGFYGPTRHIQSGTLGDTDFGSGAVLSGAIASGQVGPFKLSSGSVRSGSVCSAAIRGSFITPGNIASGTIWPNDFGGGVVASAAIGATAIGNPHINTTDPLQSGAIASGQVGTFHATSGMMVTQAKLGVDDSIVTTENVSGFMCVAVNKSGLAQVAMAAVSGRMPAVGIAMSGALSGGTIRLLMQGLAIPAASGLLDQSGRVGMTAYVNRSGNITTLAPTANSGDLIQKIGVVILSGKLMVMPGDVFSGLPSFGP